MRSSWRAIAPEGLNVWASSLKNTSVLVLLELPSNKDD